MPKIQHIFNELYQTNFYYVDTDIHSKFQKIIKKELGLDIPHKPTGVSGGFTTIENKDHPGNIIGLLWAPSKNIPILAHECLHAVIWDLDSKGIELSHESEEAYTYYLQFLLHAIINKIDYKNYDKLIKNAQKKQKEHKK